MVERRFTYVVLSLLAASLVSIGTVAGRVYMTHSAHYLFLIWNLFLAWVPLLAAWWAFRLARRGFGARVSALVVAWLLFFPNAPYMLTDFVHLSRDEGRRGASPLWYDALMLSSFAWTALLLGFVSLYLIHALIRRRAGDAAGWVAVTSVLGLASIGVYIGRFAHFNSWDALTRPRDVLAGIGQALHSPFHDPKMVAALFGLTAALMSGYLVVYAFSSLRLERSDA